jgi:heterodisulfide reductase subunit B2
MRYLYYPGCSLEGTAKEYHESTVSLMTALGAELVEIRDWTCCGASAAHAVSDLLSYVLPARNLALAEQTNLNRERSSDIIVPCSACYLNLKTVSEKVKTDIDLKEKINTVLKEEGLEFKNLLNIRHELDVLFKDFSIEIIAGRVQHPLTGVVAAPYYGCQCLRPFVEFDDPEKPRSMEALIRAAGAMVFDWNMGPACCGASHMTTKPEVGLNLVGKILHQAKDADVILTVCPMCQMNLEAFQRKAGHACEDRFAISVLYLPQFLGMALGLPESKTRIDLNLSVTREFKDTYRQLRDTSLIPMSESGGPLQKENGYV